MAYIKKLMGKEKALGVEVKYFGVMKWNSLFLVKGFLHFHQSNLFIHQPLFHNLTSNHKDSQSKGSIL